jgi:peptidoglycan pentaglycine glycine transferase (the first glycine)
MALMNTWNQIIRNFAGSHLLQTWEWGQAKAQFGWQPLYAVWRQDGQYSVLGENDLAGLTTQDIRAAAMILQRNIPIGGFAQRTSILYVPKGPLLDWADRQMAQSVLTDLKSIAKQRGAIFIKIDPDVSLGLGLPGSEQETLDPLGSAVMEDLQANGWIFSAEQVQFRNTCLIDLTRTEEELLAGMKQKTRYNIRLAERKGVRVRRGDEKDLPMLYQMYTETAVRDEFIIREENYYQTVLQIFRKNPITTSLLQPSVQPLIAEVDGEPIAAVVIFLFAGQAWYMYGMSSAAQRDKMPNHLLQWEAMRMAKELGCHTYDLWGAPDRFDESDPMWGVYRFKEGLGGIVARHIGAWDLPVRPSYYRLYTHTLPRLLEIMRRRQKNQSQRMVG